MENIDGPSMTNPTLDVSSLDDTARSKISSKLFDAGQISGTIHFDAADTLHDIMADDCISGATGDVVLTFPDSGGTATYTGVGLITEFTPSASTGEKISASLTIDLTGTITIA